MTSGEPRTDRDPLHAGASREEFERLMQQMMLVAERDDMPDEDDPLGRISREFFANNWITCSDGLLRRTDRIRVWPEVSPAPRAFRFEMHCAYKRKLGREAAVELVPGPVCGEVIYRGDMFVNPDGPCVAVLIDRSLGFFHPNFNRQRGLLCIGDLSDLPPGPISLDHLLENHIFPIVSYQNRRPAHPADLEAARYFALEPTAMDGLEPVEPLY